MITSLTQFKLSAQIDPADTSQDSFINALLLPVDSLIKKWLGRNLEKVTVVFGPIMKSPDTNVGESSLFGSYWWAVTSTNLNGESTFINEANVSGVDNNQTITINWTPVTNVTGYRIYRGTSSGAENVLVANINPFTSSYTDTGSYLYAATPPTVSTATAGYTEIINGRNTTSIYLRETPVHVADMMGVWVDQNAFGGQAPNAFAAVTQQTLGVDYMLMVDQPDGVTSNSGILHRLNGYWPGTIRRSRGKLAGEVVPGRGNIKATYFGGYAVVPGEITQAANLMISKLLAIGPTGFMATSESFEDRSISIDLGQWSSTLFSADIVSQLLNYRHL